MFIINLLVSSACIFLISYLIGGIPFGFLIGKFNGLDIRYHGSKNIGATNVRRVLGRDWGIVCFALDFLKGLLPVLFLSVYCCNQWAVSLEWGGIVAASGAVTGHIFPYTLKFRGGKGVATSIGAILALAFWPVIIGALFWLAFFYWSRIVSLASLCLAAAMPLTALIMYLNGWGNMHIPVLLLLLVLALLIVLRHKDNMARLLRGQENKFVKVNPDKAEK